MSIIINLCSIFVILLTNHAFSLSLRTTVSMNANAMEYSKLGKSDLLVSKVCLGTMTLGQQNTLDEGVDQLNIATKEYGINFIDTAEMYPIPTKPDTQGLTDKTIAKWLKTVDRSKVILASKVCGNAERLTWLPGREGRGTTLSRNDIIVSVDESLKRLGTEYVDLLQLHWPDRYVPMFGAAPYQYGLERDAVSFEEQLRALDEVIKSGKVRYIGLSNETPYGVMKFTQLAALYGLPTVVSLQNCYNLIFRSDFENGLKEVCSPRYENIALLPYSPLAGGILTGKYATNDLHPNSRFNLFPGKTTYILHCCIHIE